MTISLKELQKYAGDEIAQDAVEEQFAEMTAQVAGLQAVASRLKTKEIVNAVYARIIAELEDLQRGMEKRLAMNSGREWQERIIGHHALIIRLIREMAEKEAKS